MENVMDDPEDMEEEAQSEIDKVRIILRRTNINKTIMVQ